MPDRIQSDMEMLTIEEAAQILRVSRTKVYELRKKGLPVVRLDGSLRIIRSSLFAWIKSREE